MALAEAESMARRGELRARVRTQAFLGALGIGGGLLAVAASSLVLIPFIIGVVMLIGAYLLIKLVPNHIATWLRRSLYGKEQETFRFQPFQSMQEEQESLKMVFSGIEFDMNAVRFGETLGGALVRTSFMEPGGAPRPLTEEERAILQNIELTVTVRFPKGLKGGVKVLLKYNSSEEQEHYLDGALYSENRLLPVDKYGQVLTTSDDRSVARDSSLKDKQQGFILDEEEDKTILMFDMGLDFDVTSLEGEVIYFSGIGSEHRVIYPMEV